MTTKIHQGWKDEESRAVLLPAVKVPMKWLKKTLHIIRVLEKELKKPTRFFRGAGSVQVLFKNGTVVSFMCPFQCSVYYSDALQEEYNKFKNAV